MKRNINIRVLLIIIFSGGVLFGEGWTKKAGTGYYALDFRILNASKYHNSSGDNIDIDEITDLAFNFYGEYGITDDITFRLNFPFYKRLTAKESSAENSDFKKDNSGVGDLDLGIRYKFAKFGQTSLAASLTFGIPISTDHLYGDIEKYALSDGEYNQIIGLGIGHSLYPIPAYISGGIKFNNRNEGYSDQIRIGIETGYKPIKNLLVNLRLNLLKSLKNGRKEVDDNIIPIMANNQEYVAIKLGTFYNFYNNIGIALSADFGLAAKNVLSAPVFSLGFYIK